MHIHCTCAGSCCCYLSSISAVCLINYIEIQDLKRSPNVFLFTLGTGHRIPTTPLDCCNKLDLEFMLHFVFFFKYKKFILHHQEYMMLYLFYEKE